VIQSYVPATTYFRNGAALVALASWDPAGSTVTLTFDRERIGLTPSSAVMEFPCVRELQQACTLPVSAPITVEPLKGVLIIVREGDPLRR
jgi:Glycoside hydrolase 123, N-terminal domain